VIVRFVDIVCIIEHHCLFIFLLLRIAEYQHTIGSMDATTLS